MNLHIRAVFGPVKGFTSDHGRFFAICDEAGATLAVFTTYTAADDIIKDSRKIVSKWTRVTFQTPPRPRAIRSGHGLLT